MAFLKIGDEYEEFKESKMTFCSQGSSNSWADDTAQEPSFKGGRRALQRGVMFSRCQQQGVITPGLRGTAPFPIFSWSFVFLG
jgi:hypothetical protein